MAEKLSDEEQKYFESGGEETPEPETVEVEEAEAVEEAAPERKESMVPHGAFHEEREERKRYQREAEEFRRKLEEREAFQRKLEERLDALTKQPEVSFDENPADYLKTGLDTTSQRLEEIQKKLAESETLTQQQKAEQAFVQSYRMQAQQFAQQQKDFGPAYQHWQQSRAVEYKMAGWPDSEIPNMVNQDEKAFVYRAMQDGVNPAQRIYELAKHRGYKPAASEDEKLDTIERGQKQKSIGSNGAAPKKLTLESLAEMSDEDFAEATKGGKWASLLK